MKQADDFQYLLVEVENQKTIVMKMKQEVLRIAKENDDLKTAIIELKNSEHDILNQISFLIKT